MAANRRALAVLVFAGALAGYFCYYGISNDHYDRLARARQIAMFGEVPFRDFFDPGYFLTLYSSALLIRIFGDNLLGEFLLNLSCLAMGTTLVFLLASRVSRSTPWGLLAAGLVVAAEPRPYDYDKILFYPLGLYACWAYVDQPSIRRLVGVAGVTVLAAMFRYDSGVYIGTAALVALVARHWGNWGTLVRRTAMAALVMAVFAAPALLFIQTTAGLREALQQISMYARIEGVRSKLFVPATFSFDRDATVFDGVVNPNNALAWLYHVALGLPMAAVLIPLSQVQQRRQVTVARLLTYATLAELVAAFILRDPLAARVPAVMPLIGIGGGILVGTRGRRESNGMAAPGTSRIGRGAALTGLAFCAVTCLSVADLIWLPPSKNLTILSRIRTLARTPPALELLPRGEAQPLVEYLRDCTKASDRVLVGWFAGEDYFFSGRGFAAGLPAIFGEHWTDLRYQRRALSILEGQSVPIILTLPAQPLDSYGFLWTFVTTHYDLVHEGTIGVNPPVQVWARRGLPVARPYGPLMLPCYAGEVVGLVNP